MPHARRRPSALAAPLLALALVSPLALAPPASAAPTVDWKQMLGRGLRAVAVDATGDVFVTGFALRSTGDPYLILVKLDPAGAELWRRTYRPRGGVASGVDLSVGSDGSVFLAGSVGSNHLEGGGWLLRRYSADGDLLWSRVTPRWRRGTAVGIDAIAAGADRVVVAGNDFSCCGDVANDGWIRAYDLDGSRLWTRPFEAPRPRGTNDAATAIAIGRSGGIYAAGWIATGPEPNDTERADHEIIVQRLRSDGAVSWTKVFFDRRVVDRDAARSVAVRGDAVVVAAESGGSWTRRRSPHAWLARLSPTGSLVWKRTWGADRARAAQPASVSIDPTGLALVAGAARDPSDTGTDAFLRAYSLDGDLAWHQRYEEGATDMAGTDVWAVGGAAALTGTSETDGWVWSLSG
jgi:hypothetical protein